MAAVILTEKQAIALEAFCESFDLLVTGAWTQIAENMSDSWGIYDPEADLESARAALRGES